MMEIIKITNKDITTASEVLVSAFQEDPIFLYIFGSHEKYLKRAPWLMSTWVAWSVKYGEAWMTADGNSVVLTRSLPDTGMALWSMIRAGMLPTPIKLGWSAFYRFYFRIVKLLEKKNHQHMAQRPHWYGWMIGVRPEYRGIGKILINHIFNIADREGLPLYLETSTIQNVELYTYLGFKQLDQTDIEEGNFSLFFMMRPPKNHLK